MSGLPQASVHRKKNFRLTFVRALRGFKVAAWLLLLLVAVFAAGSGFIYMAKNIKRCATERMQAQWHEHRVVCGRGGGDAVSYRKVGLSDGYWFDCWDGTYLLYSRRIKHILDE